MIFLKIALDINQAILQDRPIKIKGRKAPPNLKERPNIMKNKIVTTTAKLSDGSTVTVNSNVRVPETLEELKQLAANTLETQDVNVIDSHLTDLFVSWCVAHTYQSQVRSKIKTASVSLTYDELSDLVSDLQFRIPRPASAPRGDKVVLKKSQLTAEQIEKLRELGLL